MNSYSHTPVLLFEATERLNVVKGKKYIDATIGGGGHTREIIKRGGYLLGIDQDQDALNFVDENQKENIEAQKSNHRVSRWQLYNL